MNAYHPAKGAPFARRSTAKAAKPKAEPLWDEAWARFAGLYRSPHDDGIDQIVLINKQLVLLSGSAASAETKVVLEPLGDGQFRLTAPKGGGAIGEVVRFDETPARPARLYRGDSWSERVDSF